MADTAHPKLQQVLSDYKSPRKAALCGSKIVCMCIARYDMVENQWQLPGDTGSQIV